MARLLLQVSGKDCVEQCLLYRKEYSFHFKTSKLKDNFSKLDFSKINSVGLRFACLGRVDESEQKNEEFGVCVGFRSEDCPLNKWNEVVIKRTS